MRVLHLNDHLGYPQGVRHGHTTWHLAVLPRLLAAGVEVEACFLRDPHPAADALRALGIPVRFLRKKPYDPGALSAVAVELRRSRPDVLHAAQVRSCLIARALKPFARTRVVTSTIDFEPLPPTLCALSRALPQPDVSIAVSEPVRAFAVREHGYSPGKVRLLHNAIDLSALRTDASARGRLRAAWEFPPDAKIVAFTGRLHEEKRAPHFLRMLPALLEQEPALRVVVAGDGPERPLCETIVRDLRLNHIVRLLGFRHDVPDILSASDVAVMLCPHEAFGFAAVEALGTGIPVVGYAGGGLPEVVQSGVNGALAPVGDDATFVALLVRMLRDDGWRGALASRCIASAERFDIDRYVAKLLRIYRGEADVADVMPRFGELDIDDVGDVEPQPKA